MTARLRPKARPAPAPAPAPTPHDDLAGIEAFAPHAEGSADDPFVKAFADDARSARRPRHARPGAEEVPPDRRRLGLAVAVVVLLLGIVAAVAVDDDEGDGDLSITSPSTTTTRRSPPTTRPATTTIVGRAGPDAPTTSALFPLATATTTAGGTTASTRPLTTPTFPTTTAPVANQPLAITVAVEPAAPRAGEVARVTIRYTDPDAPPTSNCRRIEVEGGPTFTDPCTEPACTSSGDAAGGGQGGFTEVTFDVTWAAAGEYDVVAAGQSVQPYCGDRFGSAGTTTVSVTVAEPAPTTTSAAPPASV